MIKDYFFISFGNLRKRFLRTSLTMLGIFIGIAAVVALISLGQGMQAAVNQQFSSIGTDKVTVQGVSAGFGPPGQNSAGIITEDDVDLVRGVPGVSRAAGRLLKSVSFEFNNHLEIIFGTSMPEEADDRDLVEEALALKAEYGRLLKASDHDKVVIGNHYWSEDHFGKPLLVGDKVSINGRAFEVVGLLEKGAAFANDAILINEADLQDLIGKSEELSAIVAQVVPGEKPSEVAERVSRAMRRDRGQKEGFEDFTVETSEELISSINTILGVIQAVFIGIATISLFVGGVGIMNTMYTSVLERTREIGIMKAIGARNSDIMWLFLFESGLLGMVGGLIGILLGMGMSLSVELIGRQIIGDVLQASFPWYLIVGSLMFSFVVGVASGLLPARQASRLPPVEALRGD